MPFAIVSVGKQASMPLDDVIALFRSVKIDQADLDSSQGLLAAEAFLRFGKGRHPARLNMGDCFSYALAKSPNAPLLFKGDDFTRTDIASTLVTGARP